MTTDELDTSRPVCDLCGTTTVRGGSQNHKGLYSCPNPACSASFKVWWRRASRSTGQPQHKVAP